MEIRVQMRGFVAIWGVVLLIIGAGWAAYALLGQGNGIFFGLMDGITLLLLVSMASLVRLRRSN